MLCLLAVLNICQQSSFAQVAHASRHRVWLPHQSRTYDEAKGSASHVPIYGRSRARKAQAGGPWLGGRLGSTFLLCCITSLVLINVAQSPYQPSPVPFASRLFKPVSSSRSSLSDENDAPSSFRACRLRVGRGGRRMLDRRIVGRRASPPPPSPPPSSSDEGDSDEEVRRLAERWRYDDDDAPAFGGESPEEHDRKLVDDYEEPCVLSSRFCSYLSNSLRVVTSFGVKAFSTSLICAIFSRTRPFSCRPQMDVRRII